MNRINQYGYTFKPLENAFRVIAWGRGIPSTTMAVMSARGDLQHVDAVIHADAGCEHERTYEIGDFYLQYLNERGIYAEVIKSGDIIKQGAEEHIHIPFWTETGGPLQRQCSNNFKVMPQRRRIRELFNLPAIPHKHSIEQWIGFTLEEVDRMKPSGVQFIANRWPLIEKRMTRADCIKYLQEIGLPIPVPSSCIICPYKDATRWLATSNTEFQLAVEFDHINRNNPLAARGNSTADRLYIYRYSPIALADAPLEIDARKHDPRQLSIFSCEEGFCGV